MVKFSPAVNGARIQVARNAPASGIPHTFEGSRGSINYRENGIRWPLLGSVNVLQDERQS